MQFLGISLIIASYLAATTPSTPDCPMPKGFGPTANLNYVCGIFTPAMNPGEARPCSPNAPNYCAYDATKNACQLSPTHPCACSKPIGFKPSDTYSEICGIFTPVKDPKNLEKFNYCPEDAPSYCAYNKELSRCDVAPYSICK